MASQALGRSRRGFPRHLLRPDPSSATLSGGMQRLLCPRARRLLPRLLHPRLLWTGPLLEQNDHVRDRRVIQIQSLRSLRFQPNAIGVHSQQARHAHSNRRGVRSNLRRSQNQAGIDVGHAVTRVLHAFQRLAQEDNGVCSLPLRVRRRKQCPNIRRRHSAQQRVSDSVQQHVAIRVSTQPLVVSQSNAANLQRNPRAKLMRIKPVPNSQDQPLSLRGFTRINADFLPFILIDQPPKLGLNTEVQEQANFNVCRTQIVQQLLLARLIDSTSRLEFKQNLAANQHISPKIPDLLAPEPNRHGNLPLHSHPSLDEGKCEGLLVDTLKKTVPYSL